VSEKYGILTLLKINCLGSLSKWQKSMPRSIQYTLFSCVGFLLAGLILDFIFPFRIEVCWSPVIRDRKGEWMGAYLSCDDKWRIYPPSQAKLSDLEKIILFKEDKYFYYHPGFNPFAIVRATIQNLMRGEVHSGASTLTMQLARMLHRRERTISSKLLETFRAIQLELHYSKAEILNAYLSLLPYGGNLEGITAASKLYFDKDPDFLSLSQRVILSVIPNNPNRLSIRKNPNELRSVRDYWLRQLWQHQQITRDEYQDALTEQVQIIPLQQRLAAPHFCQRLKSLVNNKGEIISTLDLQLQHQAKAIGDSHIRRWQLAGISQYAVLITKNDSGNVLAYLGSSNFDNKLGQGEVDGLRAVRSPGSALKPIAYSLAYDHGYITPASMLPDIPLDFGGYQPENFDKIFHGKVSASFALAHSLNLPAVYLLEKIGLYHFLDKLVQLEFASIRKKRKQLGLSTILGGCGITAEELIQVYLSLANRGSGPKLKYIASNSLDTLPRLCSPEAAWMVTQDLTQHTRPDLPNGFQNGRDVPHIAWKTGTSYGRRDAWSIGYNGDYTILVWFGNFDGTASPLLSGADVATPMLFDLFNMLPKQTPSQQWQVKPSDIQQRKVCPESGDPPAPSCPYTIIDYFISGVSSVSVCSHLKNISVSNDKSIAFCHFCRPTTNSIEVYYPNYSPEHIEWMMAENIPFENKPPHNPNCSYAWVEEKLTILTPAQGQDYLLEKENTEGIPFRCLTPADAQMVHWYLNGKFIGTSPARDPLFFSPPEGQSQVQCVDDKGRSGKSWFKFERY
jgi:penicillin-binding protein 1C